MPGPAPPHRPKISRKVAHLTTVDQSLRFLLLPQLQALRDNGYEVSALSAPGPWRQELESHGLRVRDVPHLVRGRHGPSDLMAVLEIAKLLRRERFDILHTHTPKAGLLGRLAAKLAGQPNVVHTIHGLPANEYSPRWKHALVWTIERIGATLSDHVLLQNEEDLQTVRRTRMVSRSHSSLLGNGVDVTRFAPQSVGPASRDRLRRELKIDPDALVVGMVARLIRRKGFYEFFEAAEQLHRRTPKCVFLCAGAFEPSQADGIPESLMRDLTRRGVLIHAGVRTDVERLYALMDIAVLPSYFPEGIPRSLMEPASMGKPLVAANSRGCRDIVQPGRNGTLVPARNSAALTQAIAELLDSPQTRVRMGQQSRQLVLERFDERLMTRRTLDVYAGFLAKGDQAETVG